MGDEGGIAFLNSWICMSFESPEKRERERPRAVASLDRGVVMLYFYKRELPMCSLLSLLLKYARLVYIQ